MMMDPARIVLLVLLLSAVGCCANPIVYGTVEDDPHPKRTAMALYFGPGPEDRRETLLDLLDDIDDCSDTRAIVVEGALCFLDTDEDGRPVEASAAVRVTAVRVLGHLEAREAEEAVISSLLASKRQDRSAAVRVESVLALRAFGGTEAVAALRVALREDSDVEVRLAAARELGALGDASAQTSDALILGLEDNSSDVRNNARNSLATLLGGDHGISASGWRAWLDARPDPGDDEDAFEGEFEPDEEEPALPPEEEFGDEAIEPFEDEDEDEQRR